MDAAAMDKMVEQAAQQSTGTYSNSRQVMKPAQQTLPRDEKGGGVMDYLRRLGGSK